MTSSSFVVVVEGGSDLSTYDKLCEFAMEGRKDYLIIKASDFKGISNGKSGVMALFVKSTARGEIKKVLFIVDRDIDDLRSCLVTHRNIFTTRYYNIENEIVRSSDLISSLAIVCGESRASVHSWIPVGSNLLTRLAGNYVTWMAFCVLVKTRGPTAGCGNYGVGSPLFGNYRPSNLLRNPKTLGVCRLLRRAMNISSSDFIKQFEVMEGYVLSRVAAGEVDAIFNGKWYFVLLSEWVKNLGVISGAKSTNMDKRLRDVMVSNLQSNCELVERLRTALNAV